MAKYECNFNGNFDEFLNIVHEEILGGSISANYEDGSYYENDGVRCAIRVYERYSFGGGNRVSLSITLVTRSQELFLSAITSGGSQAVFFKLNRFGENAFLDRLVKVVEEYRSTR